MKTFYLIIVLLAFSFAAAQEPSEVLVIEKGTWNLTGSVALSFQNNENGFNQQENSSEGSTNFFLLAPSFGYAIKNNIVIGAGLNYSHQKFENSVIGLDSNNNSIFSSSTLTRQFVGITPYISGYKGIGKQLSLYLQGEASYGRSWSTSQQNGESTNDNRNGNNLFIGIRPGITYFLHKKLAIESTFGSLGYSFTESKSDGGSYSNNNDFNLAINPSNLFFGIAYYF